VTEDAVYPSAWLPPIPSPAFNRLIRAEMKISRGSFVPETVSIETVRKKNPNYAKYVKLHGIENPSYADPDEEQIKKAIEQALEMGAVVITFTEGDPMLNEKMPDYVRYVDKTKAVVMAYTWGLNFTPEKAKALKDAGLQTLLVSIYSTDPDVHDKRRGIRGAYEKAVDAIRCGLDAGLLVTMATHLDDGHIEEMEKLRNLSKELGVHEFSIWETVPTLEGEKKIGDLSRKKIRDFYKRVNTSSEDGPRIFANTVFEGEMFGAMAGRRWLHVTTEGEVWADPYIPMAYGNINKEPLKKIWKKMRKESVFRKKRDAHVLYEPAYLQKVRQANNWDFRQQTHQTNNTEE
jgi:MoaA/NifB/PqqE/SkfB family radical SAM enzyme